MVINVTNVFNFTVAEMENQGELHFWATSFTLWLVRSSDIIYQEVCFIFMNRSARNAWRISRFRLYWIKVTKPSLLYFTFSFFVRDVQCTMLVWSDLTRFTFFCVPLSFISANAFRSQFLFLPVDDEFTVLLFSKALSGNQSFIASLLAAVWFAFHIDFFFWCCE